MQQVLHFVIFSCINKVDTTAK